jgi:hypothetical protein
MKPCEVPGCERMVGRERVMCADHWRRVPLLLKAEVNAAWANRRFATGGPHYAGAARHHEEAKRKAVAAVVAKGVSG